MFVLEISNAAVGCSVGSPSADTGVAFPNHWFTWALPCNIFSYLRQQSDQNGSWLAWRACNGLGCSIEFVSVQCPPTSFHSTQLSLLFLTEIPIFLPGRNFLRCPEAVAPTQKAVAQTLEKVGSTAAHSPPLSAPFGPATPVTPCPCSRLHAGHCLPLYIL